MKIEYKKLKLANGIRVLIIPQKSTAAVTSLVLVKTGSHNETKNLSGVSHFLEHLFFKGSKKYPSALKISTILDNMGAGYNAFTSEEVTGFYVKVVKNKIEVALDVMSDFLKNPLFIKKEVEKERGVILEELRMYYDMPQRHVIDLFKEALYGNQPAGRDIGGSEKSVLSIEYKDIVNYFESQYRGDNVVVIFAGNISYTKAQFLAKKYFGDLQKGKAFRKDRVKKTEDGFKIILKAKESDQTHIALGFVGVDLYDKRRYALDVLSVIMGGGMSSRLFTEIREKRGLAYYVQAGASEGTDFGYFMFTAGIANKKLDEALIVLANEFKKIKRTLVSFDELTKAKNNIEGSTLLGIETSDALAFELGAQEILLQEIETPLEYLKKIKKVTSAQVRKVAQELFITQTMRFALVGPYKNRKKLEEILGKI